MPMTTLRRHAALLSLATLVACGGAADHAASTPAPTRTATPQATITPVPPPAGLAADRLWLQRNGSRASVDIVDAATLHTLSSFPAGTASADWTRMYSVSVDEGFGTALHVTDPRSGAALDRVHVDTGMDLPQVGAGGNGTGLSPSGRYLVLAGGPRDSTGNLTSSEFRVYDTRALHAAPRSFSLPGTFLFDGIDDGGRTLCLLQYHMLSDASPQIQLRRFDLVAARLDPNPIVPAGQDGPTMTGIGVDTVATADGAYQVTAYAFGSTGPFLQVVALHDARAWRIDLAAAPSPGGQESEVDLIWSLVRSQDGRHVYATNPGTGSVVDVATVPPFHARAESLPVPSPSPTAAGWSPFGVTVAEAKRALYGGAALSPDGRTLYAVGLNGIAVIATDALKLRTTFALDSAFQSLALSPDGRHLFAVETMSPRGGVVQLDTTTGAAIAIPATADVAAVLRVSAAT
jgi:hypothetical protein